MLLNNQPNVYEPVQTRYHVPATYTPDVWWHNTQSARAVYFEILKCFNCQLSPNALRRMRSKLLDADRGIERVSQDPKANGARECILAAVADMEKALTACIDGNTTLANSYVRASQIELGILTTELDELNLFCSDTYMAAIHD